MKAIAGLAAAAITSVAGAGIVGFVGDTTLEGGWYAFEAEYGLEGQMNVIYHGGSPYEEVMGIDFDFGCEGSLEFSVSHSLRHIGYGWATWSHGYTGEIFYNNGAYSGDYSIEGGCYVAFDAYIEPNPFQLRNFYVTATGSAGGEAYIEFTAHGSAGASHFGFYATGEVLVNIHIDADTDWGIGEWRVAVPGPGALALLGLAALRRRRR